MLTLRAGGTRPENLDLKSRCEGPEDGEGSTEVAIPIPDLRHSSGGEVAIRVAGFNRLFERLDPRISVVDVGLDLVAENAVGQFAQAGFCRVVVFPITGDIDEIDRPDVSQPAGAFARGTPTDAQPGYEIVKGEGVPGAEEQTVNLSE